MDYDAIFSVIGLILGLGFYAAFCLPMLRIIRRAGRRRWEWAFFIIPGLNLIYLWVFAFVRWPVASMSVPSPAERDR